MGVAWAVRTVEWGDLVRKAVVGITLLMFVAAGLPTVPAPANGADVGGERLVRTHKSLLGTHRWLQQTYRGVDVLDGLIGEHVYREGGSSKDDGRKTITDNPAVKPSVTKAQALAAAGPGSRDATLAIKAGSPSRLVWAVKTVSPDGATRTLIDAINGSVVEVKHTEVDFDGSGTVFDPNPIVALMDPTLVDANDANLPVFGPAYRSVTLRHLDGSGFLRGDYASITGPAGEQAFSASLDFDFDRSSSGFSQTMAYYHVTTAQEYIQQLGFTDVNNQPQQVFADAFPDEGSFFDGLSIYLGTGGVDDAEDADIIWHEYGHAIQFDQVPLEAFFGGDMGAIGEGFGDYWAVTMSQPVNADYNVPCVAEWDVAGYPTPRPCLRRVDLDLVVADRIGEVHFDGQIWSRALWDINQALGRDAANTLILEAQFGYPPHSTFADAARVNVETAQRLFGSHGAKVVRKAFHDRGITPKPVKVVKTKPSKVKAPTGLHEVARLGAPEPGGGAYVDVFEPYDLNDRSDALFASNVSTGGQAVFVADKKTVRQVARSGDTAPGGGVFGFGVEAGSELDGAGNAAFSYYLDPFELPFGRNAGVYRSGPGATRAIVVPGETIAPTGGVFLGAGELTSTNDRGEVAFAGMISTESGISDSIGMGTFVGHPDGSIDRLVVPGDVAPGGSTFDYAGDPSINAIGDVAFTGHLAGTVCESGVPQTTIIGCDDELFLRRASTGQVVQLTSRGATAPGGGVFLDIMNPVLSDNGDVLFVGVVETETSFFLGVYVVRGGAMTVVARGGDAMPGGGPFLTTGYQPGNADINDRGDIAFSATLDADDNGDGLIDQGLYRWTAGTLSVVVRSGVVLPAGQVVAMQSLAQLGSVWPFGGAAINRNRRLLWQVTVVDGAGSLQTVLYTSG
jgi:hypothetical protein